MNEFGPKHVEHEGLKINKGDDRAEVRGKKASSAAPVLEDAELVTNLLARGEARQIEQEQGETA
jgi:hypothetical protein